MPTLTAQRWPWPSNYVDPTKYLSQRLFSRDSQGRFKGYYPWDDRGLDLRWAYVLYMNDMRAFSIRSRDWVAIAKNEQALKALMRAERVEPYTEPRTDGRWTWMCDDQWGKVHRKGGPLEWYNPGGSIELVEERYEIERFIRRIKGQMQIGRHRVFLLNESAW